MYVPTFRTLHTYTVCINNPRQWRSQNFWHGLCMLVASLDLRQGIDWCENVWPWMTSKEGLRFSAAHLREITLARKRGHVMSCHRSIKRYKQLSAHSVSIGIYSCIAWLPYDSTAFLFLHGALWLTTKLRLCLFIFFFIYVAARRHIFVCFMAKSAFWRGFSALAPYTGVGPI